MENSSTAILPPGLATRTISSNPRVVSLTLRNPKATQTTWNELLGNGSRWASASTNRSCPLAGPLRAFCSAMTSMSRQKSAPTIGTVVADLRQ